MKGQPDITFARRLRSRAANGPANAAITSPDHLGETTQTTGSPGACNQLGGDTDG